MQMTLPLEWEQSQQLKLTEEQQSVFESVLRDIASGRPYVTIGGLAGTGKSVLLAALARHYSDFSVCAPTWQVAHMLNSRGVPATTAHRLLYRSAKQTRDEYGRLVLEFEPKPGWFQQRQLRGVIMDEAGMCNRLIFNDLLGLNVPVIFLGDHGQLPPVNDDFELMRSPHYTLQTVHRNASDIVRFALWLRQGHSAKDYDFQPGSAVERVDQARAIELSDKVDQIGCSFNRTRVRINAFVRKQLGRTSRLEPGDRIVVLSTSASQGVFNGMAGTVESVDWNNGWVTMQSDHFGKRYFEADFGSLDSERPMDRVSSSSVAITYAYARTAYGLQGTECGSLLVKEEDSRQLWSDARCNYTLATRAKTKLYWQPLS